MRDRPQAAPSEEAIGAPSDEDGDEISREEISRGDAETRSEEEDEGQEATPQASVAAANSESGDGGHVRDSAAPRDTSPPSDFYRWKLAWTRKLIAEAIDRCEFGQVVKLLALGIGVWKIPHEAVNQVFDEALRGNIDYSRRRSVTVNLLAANDIQLEQVIGEVVASWFWNEKDGPAGDVPAEDCEEVAAFLEIDLKAEWQAGNILAPRALIELYDDEGLRDLAARWTVKIGDDWNRKGIVAKLEQRLASEDFNSLMPGEVARAKRK